jgi:hypothetical protein
MPSPRNLNEFMFLSSVLVPSPISPARRTETFASQRSDPFSMSQSDTPIVWSVFFSRPRKATACSGERRSGSVTISTSGVPQRLKSTTDDSAPAMRPPDPPACTSLAASSSRCARVIPIRPPSTSRWPRVQIGWSYWLIWYALGLSG